MTGVGNGLAIRVRSIDEEDALLGRCHCGGEWRRVAEEVAPIGRRWYDALVVCCSACGAPKRAIFDITPFFKPMGTAWIGIA